MEQIGFLLIFYRNGAPPFLRVGNLLRLRADQFTTTRGVGLTEISSSGQRLLSLRSAMANIVGCFIT